MLRRYRASILIGLALLTLLSAIETTRADDEPSPLATAIKDLASPKESVQIAAADSLGAMGENAVEAVPLLSKALGEKSAMVRAHAARALGRIGEAAKDAGPALAELVADPNDDVRRSALNALRKIKPDRDKTLPIISQALAHADPSTRVHALQSIADMGEAAVPALIKALEHSEGKYWALLVLGELGPKAKDAVPGMAKLLNDDSVQVRREAVMALGMVGKDAESAVPQIAKALDDEQMAVRYGAAFALGSLGPTAKSAVPALQAQLKGDDEFMQLQAAWALAKIQDKDPAAMDTAVKVLTNAITNKDAAVRRAGVRALLDLKPGPAKVLPALRAAFDAADPVILSEALDAIAEAGEPALPGIIAALKIKESRGRAANIVGRMGSKGAKAVAALTEALADERPSVRREVAFALGAIGPEAASATPALVKLLSDDEANDDHAMQYALGRIGPGAKAAIPALIKELQAENSFERQVSAWALAQISPQDAGLAKKLVPVLIQGLDNDQPMVRAESANGLGKLGANAAAAVDALTKASKDPEEVVSAAANEALKKIKGKG